MDPENTTPVSAAPEEKPAEGGVITESPPKSEAEVLDEKIAAEAARSELEKRQREIEEQDKKLLAVLDEVLEKRSVRFQSEQPQTLPKERRFSKSVAKKGIGFISLSLILIFLGIVMIVCLFSPSPDFLLPLKLSPLCAVLIGVEILFNQVSTRGNFRVNLPSIIISALLVVGCCIMCVALGKHYSAQKEEYNNRSIAAEIYDKSYKELRYVADIASLKVDVDLNPDGTGRSKGAEALSSDDYVNITVKFAGVIESPREFASYCKKVIDGYRFMGISVTNFYFENTSTLHTYNLSVEGKFAQDYPESKLAELVDHIYIADMNYFEDLIDFVEESDENSGN